MSRGECCRWAYGSSLPQLREDVVGTVTLSDRTFQRRLHSAPGAERRLIPGVDLSSASPAEAAINGGDATRHDCQRSRQQFPTSLRSAAVDAPLVRLTRQTAPPRDHTRGRHTVPPRTGVCIRSMRAAHRMRGSAGRRTALCSRVALGTTAVRAELRFGQADSTSTQQGSRIAAGHRSAALGTCVLIGFEQLATARACTRRATERAVLPTRLERNRGSAEGA